MTAPIRPDSCPALMPARAVASATLGAAAADSTKQKLVGVGMTIWTAGYLGRPVGSVWEIANPAVALVPRPRRLA